MSSNCKHVRYVCDDWNMNNATRDLSFEVIWLILQHHFVSTQWINNSDSSQHSSHRLLSTISNDKQSRRRQWCCFLADNNYREGFFFCLDEANFVRKSIFRKFFACHSFQTFFSKETVYNERNSAGGGKWLEMTQKIISFLVFAIISLSRKHLHAHSHSHTYTNSLSLLSYTHCGDTHFFLRLWMQYNEGREDKWTHKEKFLTQENTKIKYFVLGVKTWINLSFFVQHLVRDFNESS